MDPRIAARRREVVEGSARQSLIRLMRWLVVILALVGLGWFAQSTPFQVANLAVFGIEYSEGAAILEAEQITEGRPLLYIRPSNVEEALLADPWISDATVGVVFPDSVDVVVVERTPITWVVAGGTRGLLAFGGIVVPGDDLDLSLPTIRLGDLEIPEPGEIATDARLQGGVEFLAALDPAIASRGSLAEIDRELWFIAPGLRVRLGRPIEMKEKAAALMALVQRGVPADATVHLITPTRPAIETPDG